jgi:hypothetical protein
MRTRATSKNSKQPMLPPSSFFPKVAERVLSGLFDCDFTDVFGGMYATKHVQRH